MCISRALIEELMLLANEVIAELCVARDLPAVFRVHGKPDEEHLARFAAVALAYGHKIDIEAGQSPKKLAAVLRKVEGKPEGRILGMMLLRSLPQAKYASMNTGHFGLASEAYLHFTSPIRRYPDVVVHRLARAVARREKIARGEEAEAAVMRAAAVSSRLERRAMDVEREILDLYRCEVARAHVGELHTATVTGVSATGPWVEIEDPFLTGMLRLTVKSDNASEWQVDEYGASCTHAVTGITYALGDVTMVELADVSMARRTVYFSLPHEEFERLRRMRKTPVKNRGREQRPGKKKKRR
jgi:ribonuclease R